MVQGLPQSVFHDSVLQQQEGGWPGTATAACSARRREGGGGQGGGGRGMLGGQGHRYLYPGVYVNITT